jgi:hypothetical protein
VRAVEQHHGAGARVFEDGEPLEKLELMTTDEVCARNEVGAGDIATPEAKMRGCDCARLFRVVDEVALRLEVRFVAHDFRGVLARANGAVGTETIEDGLVEIVGRGIRVFVHFEGLVRDVVDDADRKVSPWSRLDELVENGLGHRRCEFFRRKPVASADHFRLRGAISFSDRRNHVEVKRFAGRTRLLRAVEHRDASCRGRQATKKVLHRKRAIQRDADSADTLVTAIELGNRLFDGSSRGAHRDDYAFGLWMTEVFEWLVASTRALGEGRHHALHHSGAGKVKAVCSLACLEEDVRILCRASNVRSIGAECAATHVVERIIVDQRSEIIVAELVNWNELVRGSEAVEEVQEGNATRQRCGLCDRREVMGLLHRRRGEHREARLTARHHIGVVAEDAEGVRRNRTRRDVYHAGQELTGNLVQVGKHQQKALRRCERRGERACLKRAVNRSCGTTLR